MAWGGQTYGRVRSCNDLDMHQTPLIRSSYDYTICVPGSPHDTGGQRVESDADFRFFPAIADALFGYRLHVADLATNKALAAAGRREPRDVLDLIYIDERHLPLG